MLTVNDYFICILTYLYFSVVLVNKIITILFLIPYWVCEWLELMNHHDNVYMGIDPENKDGQLLQNWMDQSYRFKTMLVSTKRLGCDSINFQRMLFSWVWIAQALVAISPDHLLVFCAMYNDVSFKEQTKICFFFF